MPREEIYISTLQEEPKFSTRQWVTLTGILSVSIFLDISTYTVQVPLLPEIQKDIFNDNYTLMSAYYYSFAVFALLALLFIPFTSRLFTAKWIILVTQMIFIPANIGLYFSKNMYLSFLCRSVMGFCSSTLWAGASVFTYVNVPEKNYPIAVSCIYASESVGFMVGPFIGGLLGNSSFVCIAIIAAACLILMALICPAQKDKMIEPSLTIKKMMKELLQSMVQIESLLMYIIISLVSSMGAMNEICVTTFYTNEYASTAQSIGLFFCGYGLTYGISSFSCGPIVRFISARKQLTASLIFYGFFFVLMVKQGLFELSLEASVGLMWASGLAFGVVVTASSLVLSQSYVSNIEAAALNLDKKSVTILRLLLFLFWWYGGWFLGPLVGGVARCDDLNNLKWLYRVGGLIVLALAVMIILFTKNKSQDETVLYSSIKAPTFSGASIAG